MNIKRIEFIKLFGLGGFSALFKNPLDESPFHRKGIKPPSLKKGATIGLISPAGILHERKRYDEITEELRKMGFRISEGDHARERYGYLAGEDRKRASDLNTMFRNPEIDAIIPFRGGWGSNRILDLIDYEAIENNPKVLTGFSDITSLLLAIYAKTGLICFHGPVGKSEWTDFTRRHFERAVGGEESFVLQNPKHSEIHTISPGKARGVLLGGNLTVLTSMIGSDYLPDFNGAILFLEDIGEDYYRIDRMITQLKLNGILEKINGLVFGKCTDCKPGSEHSLTLDQIFEDHVKPLRIPAFRESMIGHIDEMFTLPIGVEAEIDADKGKISILESPTA